jgi:signal peptidase I
MKKRKEKKLSREKIISIIKEYASLAVVLFFVTASFIQGSLVPTSSMVGTIMIGDRVLVNKLAYDLTTPRNIPFTDIELPHLRLLKWGHSRFLVPR